MSRAGVRTEFRKLYYVFVNGMLWDVALILLVLRLLLRLQHRNLLLFYSSVASDKKGTGLTFSLYAVHALLSPISSVIKSLRRAREYADLCDLCSKEQTIWVFSTMLFPIHQPLLLLFSRILYIRRTTYMGSSSSSHSSTSYSHRGHFTASSEPFEGVNTNPALAS